MTLVVAPCSYEAAKYAVMNWHYSQAMPSGKLICYGAWENGRFVGAVIYGRGASPYLGKQFALDQTESCELVRVALDTHEAPVSQIVSQTLQQLSRHNPAMRLVISFADPDEGHHGGIYQAGNWLYLGRSSETVEYFINKKWSHVRSVYWHAERSSAPMRTKPGKHRYVMPLDRAMRKQLAPSALPYPRGSGVEGDTSNVLSEGPGSIPGNRSTDRSV